jgi:hypothetical protein
VRDFGWSRFYGAKSLATTCFIGVCLPWAICASTIVCCVANKWTHRAPICCSKLDLVSMQWDFCRTLLSRRNLCAIKNLLSYCSLVAFLYYWISISEAFCSAYTACASLGNVCCQEPTMRVNVACPSGWISIPNFCQRSLAWPCGWLTQFPFCSCINPLVYGFMSRNFRESFHKALARCCFRRRAQPPPRGTVSSFNGKRQMSVSVNSRTTSVRYADTR